MLRPEQLIRVVIELIFVLLGGLVVWLGLTNQIRRIEFQSSSWMILSVALILWGIYALARPARAWLRGERWTRGVSLILLGILMLGIARAPFAMIGKLLAVAGVILVLRGLVGMALILRPR
jgi:heme A synthase